MNNKPLTPNQLAHLANKVEHLNRLIELRKHGFVEQNHIARYQHKLANNRHARICRQAKTLVNNLRVFNHKVNQVVGLA